MRWESYGQIERGVVGRHPARADAELEPAVGQHVERRGLLGHDRRVLVVVAQHEHADAKRVGDRGRDRDRDHRRQLGAHEVIGHEERGVAQRFDLSGTLAPTPLASAGPDVCTPNRNGRAWSRRRVAGTEAGGPEAEGVARRWCRARRPRPTPPLDLLDDQLRDAVAAARPCTPRSGSVFTSNTLISPRYWGSMRPGVLRHVMPWRSARPERGQHEAGIPRRDRDGEAGGHERRVRRWARGSRRSRAWRSKPASSVCCWRGSGSSGSSRVDANLHAAHSVKSPSKLGALLVGEVGHRVVVGMVDHDAGGACCQRIRAAPARRGT